MTPAARPAYHSRPQHNKRTQNDGRRTNHTLPFPIPPPQTHIQVLTHPIPLMVEAPDKSLVPNHVVDEIPSNVFVPQHQKGHQIQPLYPSTTPQSSFDTPVSLTNSTPVGGVRPRQRNQDFVPTTAGHNRNSGGGATNGGGGSVKPRPSKKRGPREEGETKSPKETSQPMKSSFDLEATAFPPLPGVSPATTLSPTEVPSSVAACSSGSGSSSPPPNGCLADVVKGGVSSRRNSAWSRGSKQDGNESNGNCDAKGVTSQSSLEDTSPVPVEEESSRSRRDSATKSEATTSNCNGHVSETESESSCVKTLSYCDAARKAKVEGSKKDADSNVTQHNDTSKTTNRE